MKATWNGATIAESDDTVVVEGNHYFPESSLKRELVTSAIIVPRVRGRARRTTTA